MLSHSAKALERVVPIYAHTLPPYNNKPLFA